MFTTKGYAKLTKDAVLERIQPVDIFYHYIPDYDGSQKAFKSDLYDDTNASCNIKVFPNGSAVYKDFGNGDSFDCFSYVQNKYGCSFIEALMIISSDFNLGLGNTDKIVPDPVLLGHKRKYVNKKTTLNTVIQIKSRPWNAKEDLDYWSQYELTCDILNFFNVIPCSHIWINGISRTSSTENPFYAYKFAKAVYKVMSPYAEKSRKWVNNANTSHLQGYDQLPLHGDLLIITKSLKDVMVLYMLGYSAVAPQSEQTPIPNEIVNTIKKRFKEVTVLYDNDEAGKKGRNKLVRKHGFNFIEIPGDIKDISDYIKENGKEKTSALLNELLNDTNKESGLE